jgi:hypothetical protein
MVFGFLIHGLDAPAAAAAAAGGGSSAAMAGASAGAGATAHEAGAGADAKTDAAAHGRVWLAQFYCREGNDENTMARREAIAARVREEYELLTDPEGLDGGAPAEGARGVIPVGAGRLFASPKVLVWQQFGRCAMVVVADAQGVNVSLAAHFLCVFAAALVEHFGSFAVFASPQQLLAKPEDAYVLLDAFLPAGQLSYVRGNLVRVLLREAQALLQMRALLKKPQRPSASPAANAAATGAAASPLAK